ncbi:MAG: trypsin-like peptidase domain-containing protein [Chloroflexi bacterium]|nr:trypsin-like peptidase domain-containing protein [Chloroflexota bacterium]
MNTSYWLVARATRTWIPIVLLAVSALVACGKTTSTPVPSPSAATPAASVLAATAAPASTPSGDFRTAIRQVAEQVKPSVVQITSEQVAVDQFNRPFTIPAGVGSGFIYDTAGHILTNNHVVEGAQQLLVSLPDGRSFPGKLVGGDPQTDLAVVQISAADLPVAKLGVSKILLVGDWVVAIGNALALTGGPTVTSGVISALGRTIQEPSATGVGAGPFLFDVIQTDAPINPGNSGGPLVNLDGEVIGINTLVAGQAEPGMQAQGIGFAISIATAKPIADTLVAQGRVIHPSLNITYIPLSPVISARLRIAVSSGMLIARVTPGSSAANAGLQSNDVITAADGVTLDTDSSLAKAIDSHKPGDIMTLTVMRGQQQLTIKVALEQAP